MTSSFYIVLAEQSSELDSDLQNALVMQMLLIKCHLKLESRFCEWPNTEDHKNRKEKNVKYLIHNKFELFCTTELLN
jgi:hypothetical protein